MHVSCSNIVDNIYVSLSNIVIDIFMYHIQTLKIIYSSIFFEKEGWELLVTCRVCNLQKKIDTSPNTPPLLKQQSHIQE